MQIYETSLTLNSGQLGTVVWPVAHLD